MNKHNLIIEQPEFCTNCNAKLNKDRMVMLDYNEPKNTYSEIKGDVYYNAFPFGKVCANSVLKNKGKLIKEPEND